MSSTPAIHTASEVDLPQERPSQALVLRNQESQLSPLAVNSTAPFGTAGHNTLADLLPPRALPAAQPIASPKSLRILSLDGGGVKGYTALLILQRIFRTLKTLSGQDDDIALKPCQVFDLIIGTSTGGLIATMLGRLEMTIEDAIEQYERVGKDVFGRTFLFGKLSQAARASVAKPIYDIKDLQKAVKKLLKEKSIAEAEMMCKSGQSSCRVMLCVTNKQTSKPHVFRNYKATHTTQENFKCTIWEAASATAAAPVYFDKVKIKADGTEWVDGGYAPNRNNPVHEVVAELEREPPFIGKEIGCLVSIGTGLPDIKGVADHVLPILKSSVDMLNDAEEIANEFAKTSLYATLAASDRYFRFNVPQGMQDINLTDYKETQRMKALTDEYLRKVTTGKGVQRCAEVLLNPDANIQYTSVVEASILPQRTVHHFVPRPHYLNYLMEFFKNEKQQNQRFVLHGMGGIGKTQLALHFAHECSKKTKVFWIRSESYSSFIADFILIYSRLDPKASKAASILQQDELIQRTTVLMEKTCKTWLMVLDNTDNLDDFLTGSGLENDSGISPHLPKIGRILLTTRDSRFVGAFAPAQHSLRVDVMEIDEAKHLLIQSVEERFLQGTSDEDIEELVSELGYLPLGIAQAAVNIRDLEMTLKSYLNLFLEKRKQMELLPEPFLDTQAANDRNRSQSVLVTWEITFQLLEAKHPQSMKILEWCSLLHWRTIPSIVIRLLPDFSNISDLEFRWHITRLSHSSLAAIEDLEAEYPELNIHPLLHIRICERVAEDRKQILLEDLIEVLAAIFPYQQAGEREGLFQGSDVRLSRLLLPHVLRTMKHGADVNLTTRGAARLAQKSGSYLSDSGRHELAISICSYALDLARITYVPLDGNIINIRQSLIACLMEDKRYEDALRYIRASMHTLDSFNFQEQEDWNVLTVMLMVVNSFHLRALYLTRSSEFNYTLQEVFNMKAPKGEPYHLGIISYFVDSLKKMKIYDEALSISDKCYEEFSKIGFEALSTRYKSIYVYLMLDRANIRAAIGQLSASSDTQRQTYLDVRDMFLQCFELSRQLCAEKRDEYRTVCIAGRKAADYSRYAALYDEALNALEMTFTTLDASKPPNDIYLQTIGYFVQSISECYIDIGLVRKTSRRERLDRMLESVQVWLKSFGLSIEDSIASPNLMNGSAVCMIRTGQLTAAMSMLQRALLDDPSTLYIQNKEIWDVLHYNTVICLLRQPGRYTEACSYRNDQLEDLEECEKTHGTLEIRFARFQKGDVLYKQAKTLRDQGTLKYGDEWWQKHAKDLVEPELFHGLLFTEDETGSAQHG